MKTRNLFFLLLLLPFCHIRSQVSQPYIIDFENQSVGSYTTAMAQQDFPNASWYHGFEYDRAAIVEDNGGKVLRVKYPQGCLGPNYEEGCAVQIKWNLPEPAKTMWVSYKIKFEEGFDFRKGGKLPGLCGGKAYSGGNRPASQGDGWSARIMWRHEGTIYQYMYYIEQESNYGDYWTWQDESSITSSFVPGEWHTVTTQIILNTVNSGATTGNHDGIVRSWLDGVKVLEKSGLRLVDFDDQLIDIFYISTFHGGDNSDWSPVNDSYIRYDNFIISENPIHLTFDMVNNTIIQEEKVTVFPNPVTDKLHIQTQKTIQSIEVFSATGKCVLKTKETSFSVASLASGIYFAAITFEDGIITKTKFIKNK